MSGGAGPAEAPRQCLPRYLHRIRRAHDMADRRAGDTSTLLRKARDVFLLRARLFASESDRQVTGRGKTFYRRKAIRELRAARRMHCLIMVEAAMFRVR